MLDAGLLEEQAIYDMFDFSKPNSNPANSFGRSQLVDTYFCPVDTPQVNEPKPGQRGGPDGNWQRWSRIRLNYAANYGNTGYAQVDIQRVIFRGGFFTNGDAYDTSDITDGTSHTIAFSEVLPVHGTGYHGPPGDGMVAKAGRRSRDCFRRIRRHQT